MDLKGRLVINLNLAEPISLDDIVRTKEAVNKTDI